MDEDESGELVPFKTGGSDVKILHSVIGTPLKACSFNNVTFSPNVTFVISLQPLNALESMVVTLFGITISVKEEQPSHIELLIFVRFWGKTIELKDEQPLNA